MKIVNFQGGLGNQMFIYAFSRYLSRLYPQEKIYGSYWSRSLYVHSAFQLDRIFSLQLPPHNLFTDCISKLARFFERLRLVPVEETPFLFIFAGATISLKNI